MDKKGGKGMDLTNLKVILGKINHIQNMVNPHVEIDADGQSISFDKILKDALNSPFTGSIGLGSTLSALAISNPEKIIAYNGYKVQAQTAARFQDLENLIAKEFPGKKVIITSTMDGRHLDPKHYGGTAIDFVVEGMTQGESRKLEQLCWQAGFKPFNEYINSSYYKTGDHMHVDLI